ncbi:SbtR family transcriptional regulator [Streptomyces liliiviolaceus]|uniref:SbtR family transcriptional regulator n=1 Tax=Streptomyces liliiviolaceus TaxID=2823109 RepID=UPI00389AF3B2
MPRWRGSLGRPGSTSRPSTATSPHASICSRPSIWTRSKPWPVWRPSWWSVWSRGTPWSWLRQFLSYATTKKAIYDAIAHRTEMLATGRDMIHAAGRRLLECAQAAGAARPDVTTTCSSWSTASAGRTSSRRRNGTVYSPWPWTASKPMAEQHEREIYEAPPGIDCPSKSAPIFSGTPCCGPRGVEGSPIVQSEAPGRMSALCSSYSGRSFRCLYTRR